MFKITFIKDRFHPYCLRENRDNSKAPYIATWDPIYQSL